MPDATFFAKNLTKKLAGSKKSSTFASAKNKAAHFGVLVQLVRMPACHAGGHGFEPRTHRHECCLPLMFMPSHGVLVQLVRMPACHAGGHGFEPRTHRIKRSFLFKGKLLFLCCTLLHVVDY